MTLERLEEIFDIDGFAKWEGDNAFQGLQILSKYTTKLIEAAEHDIIYSCEVDDILDLITEEDAAALAQLNWMIEDDLGCFACYV